MTGNAMIIGIGCTAFGRRPEHTPRELAREAVMAALRDAGLKSPSPIGGIWFGSSMLDYWGQSALRGQATLLPMMRDGVLPERVPIFNVEAACASGSLALRGAVREVESGEAIVALAVGVDKLFDPHDRERILPWFRCGQAPFDLDDLLSEYRRVADAAGLVFRPDAARSLPMDTYALQAELYLRRYGSTARHLAAAAAKNRWHAALNPLAHHQSPITVDQVLADRPVVGPFTRSMCAPMTDGAAAVVVAAPEFVRRVGGDVGRRAVRIRAMQAIGGKFRSVDEPSLTRDGAQRVYDKAGVGPDDLSLVELHDATSFCELYQTEMLGLCAAGEGGALAESGATRLGGRIPVNVSGGLVGKGHPVGATGLSMIGELVHQLRGEAGNRQVRGARLALHQNGGGVMGLEEALCVLSVLERSA